MVLGFGFKLYEFYIVLFVPREKYAFVLALAQVLGLFDKWIAYTNQLLLEWSSSGGHIPEDSFFVGLLCFHFLNALL